MFGASHFFNGVLARRAPATVVAVCSQLGGAVLFLVWAGVAYAVLSASGREWPQGADLLWAGISGIGAGAGVGILYEGMRRCRLTVVVPVTSIVSVALPFTLSVMVLGDPVDPALVVAALLLIPATVLLSRPTRVARAARRTSDEPLSGNATATFFGLAAGLGYAVQLFSLSRISTSDPATPMLLGQLVSLIPLVAVLWIRTPRPFTTVLVHHPATALKAAMVGGLAALAMVSYLYATREAALAPVMVAIALYPALPVLLALIVLRERLSRTQVGGLLIAAVVLPLINVAN